MVINRRNQFLQPLVLFMIFAGCKSGNQHIFTYKQVVNPQQYNWNNDSSAIIISENTSVYLQSVPLSPGKYVVTCTAEAEIGDSILPKMSAYLGTMGIVENNITNGLNACAIKFEIQETSTESVQLDFRNFYSPANKKKSIILHFPIILSPF